MPILFFDYNIKSIITDYKTEVPCSFDDIASGAIPRHFSGSTLIIMQMNIIIVGTKRDEILLHNSEFGSPYPLIVLTETWLVNAE